MKHRPWYKRYPQDIQSSIDYRTMPLEARGLYNDLLDLSWIASDKPCYLPNNIEVLAKLTGINRRSFAKVWAKHLQKKFKLSSDEKWIFNERLLEEFQKAQQKSEINRANAKRNRSEFARDSLLYARGRQKSEVRSQKKVSNDTFYEEVANATSSCAEPKNPAPAPENGFLTFPVTGETKTWILTESQVGRFICAYETLDVRSEMKRALSWIESNPQRRKTARGMKKFLNGWLDRSANNKQASVVWDHAGNNGKGIPHSAQEWRRMGFDDLKNVYHKCVEDNGWTEGSPESWVDYVDRVENWRKDQIRSCQT